MHSAQLNEIAFQSIILDAAVITPHDRDRRRFSPSEGIEQHCVERGRRRCWIPWGRKHEMDAYFVELGGGKNCGDVALDGADS